MSQANKAVAAALVSAALMVLSVNAGAQRIFPPNHLHADFVEGAAVSEAAPATADAAWYLRSLQAQRAALRATESHELPPMPSAYYWDQLRWYANHADIRARWLGDRAG